MVLETMVAGIRLEHPVMNAPGAGRKTVQEVRELARSLSAAVMVGSITKKQRPGNPGEVYWAHQEGFSLNSLGLPNAGAPWYREHLPEMAQVVHEAGKTLWVSVAGFTPEEFATLTVLALQGGADLVELNLGCPNVWDGSRQKRIFSFDPALVEAVLSAVNQALNADRACAISVKVSPFSDPVLLEEVSSVVAASPRVAAVTAINTFPNAFAYKENGEPAINPQLSRGLAGMGGSALKPIGLGQVLQWRALLPDHIDVIGAGGIHCGRDVIDYMKAGARAVHIATAYADHGPKVFDLILAEYVSLRETETVAS